MAASVTAWADLAEDWLAARGVPLGVDLRNEVAQALAAAVADEACPVGELADSIGDVLTAAGQPTLDESAPARRGLGWDDWTGDHENEPDDADGPDDDDVYETDDDPWDIEGDVARGWLTETRHVRTPAGAKRYGVPIDSPIPSGGRPRPKGWRSGHDLVATALANRAARDTGHARARRLSPAQRIAAAHLFGDGANGGKHHGAGALTVHDKDAARAHLDKTLDRDDLTHGQRRTITALRRKVAAAEAPMPRPKVEPGKSKGPDQLPTVSEETVERHASAIDEIVDAAFLGAIRSDTDQHAKKTKLTVKNRESLRTALGDGLGSDLKRDVRARLRSAYPDATDRDLDEAARSVMRAITQLVEKKQGDAVSPPGRGVRLAVRALERKQAHRASGNEFAATVGKAREVVGDPKNFGYRPGGGARLLDVAPGGEFNEGTRLKVEALRTAGAAVSVEVDRRSGRLDKEVSAKVDAFHDASFARMEAAAGLRRDIDNEWNAITGYDIDERSWMLLQANPDFRAKPGGAMFSGQDADAFNSVAAQHRDRLTALKAQTVKVAELRETARQAEAGRAAKVAGIRREVLAEVRSMGETGDVKLKARVIAGHRGITKAEAKRLKPMLANAEATYPTDWIERMGEKQPYGLGVAYKGQRAHYSGRDHVVNVGKHQSDAEHEAVLIHEVGHAMEATNPQLGLAQYAYMRERTRRPEAAGGDPRFDELSTIYKGTSERGWKDDLPQHYSGRTYNGGGSPDTHYEVLTTAVESLFGPVGSGYADADMEHFLFGMMTLL